MGNEIFEYLPGQIRNILKRSQVTIDNLLEIRLRVQQPLQVITYSEDFFLTRNGKKVDDYRQPYIVTQNDMKRAMLILTDNSLYALERQFREGYITIKGGHRVGFTGEVVLSEGKIKTLKNINSLNYRITREVIGAGEDVIDKLYNYSSDTIYNTLIISPPLCGKTTLLRDLTRLISSGIEQKGIKGKKIGVIDERSEIAGAYNGIAQNKIGSRTDLLDNCPKANGMLMLIRAMSPEVIVADEIGRPEDVMAIKETINAGVSMLTTVHGNNLRSLKNRPSIRTLLEEKLFERYVILSKRNGAGTIERILNINFKEVI